MDTDLDGIDESKRMKAALKQLRTIHYQTLYRQGHILKSMEIMASLASEMQDDLEKLHHMDTYATYGLE